MSNNEYVSMLVCWKQQRRLINLKTNDDLDTIETCVNKIYDLQQSNNCYEHQIQYYNQKYQTFIDLCPETFPLFQQLVQELLLSNVSSKCKKIWRLKIIPKATETTRHTLHGLITSDSCNCQRTSNTKKSNVIEQDSISMMNNQIDNISISSNSVINNEDTSSQIDNEDQEKTNRFDTESIPGLAKCETSEQVATLNCVSPKLTNPLNFHFKNDIADRQRTQYESDLTRKKNSTSSSIGGVLLQPADINNSIPHPTLHFQIPKDKLNSSWSLYLYILTEHDQNGNYYLHASKGIYDNTTIFADKFGPILNSNLVNPYVIELSQNDIQQGKYEIYVRVCNIRNLPNRKQEKLKLFPELNSFMIYQDTKLESNMTTTGLNFSSEKYHLGCILVWNHIVQDRCISRLAIEGTKRTRKDNEMKTKKKKM